MMHDDIKLNRLLDDFDAPTARSSLVDDVMASLPVERPVVVRRKSPTGFVSVFGFDLRGLAAAAAALALGFWLGMSGQVAVGDDTIEDEFAVAMTDFDAGFANFDYLEDDS